MANVPNSQIISQLKGMGYNSSQAGKILAFAQANPNLRGEIMEYAKHTLMPKRPVGGVRISTKDVVDFFTELHRSVQAGGQSSALASVKVLPRYNLSRGNYQQQPAPRTNQRQQSNNRGRPERSFNRPTRRSASLDPTPRRTYVAYNSSYRSATPDRQSDRNTPKPQSQSDVIKKYKEGLAAKSALKPLPPTTPEGLNGDLQAMWEYRQLWESLLPSSWAFALNDGIDIQVDNPDSENLVRQAFVVFHYRVPIDMASPRQNTKHGAATYIRQHFILPEDQNFVAPTTIIDKQLEEVKKVYPNAFRNDNGQIVIEAEPPVPVAKKHAISSETSTSEPSTSDTKSSLNHSSKHLAEIGDLDDFTSASN